jgi:hypothetical protein
MRGSRGIVSAIIGDGTLGQGLLYESLNLASVWEVPVLFVVENNGIAQTTSTSSTTGGEILLRGEAFGLQTWRLDDAQPGFLRQAESVVRYGISMADIPLTTGQPDRGAGAYQFSAYTIYDPLVAWEMDVSDRPGKLVPGLATEWKVDEADKKKWRFTLRKAVKFHDGSDFNADAVIWNLDKVLNDKAPQFDKRQSAQVKTRLPSVASYAKIDDDTIEITTKAVDSFFPYQMLWFLVSSPAQYEKLGKDWDNLYAAVSTLITTRLNNILFTILAQYMGQEAINDRLLLLETTEFNITPEKMLDALMHVVGDRSLGQVFFGDYYLMDAELLSDPSRRAIQEQSAKRGMKLVMPTLAPFRYNAWPWRTDPKDGTGPSSLYEIWGIK